MPVHETDDTSAEDVAADVDNELESLEASFEDFDDDSSDDNEDEEDDDSESGFEDDDESDSDDETDESDDSDDEGDQSQDEESEEADTASDDDIKQHNAEMAQKRIAEKKAREQAKRDAQEQYVEEATDDENRVVRELQVEAYNNRVEKVANKIENGIDRALASIDIFRDGTDAEKEILIQSLDDFEALHVRRARNGDPLEITADVYEFLQTKADSIRKLTQEGARKEIKSKKKQKTRTDLIPSKKPKEAPRDPDLDAFDEEAGRY